jgi:hypothetical protein
MLQWMDALDAVLKDGRRLKIEVVTKNFEIRGRAVRITVIRAITDPRQLEEQCRQTANAS